MALEAIVDRPDLYKIILEGKMEGVYVLGFASADSGGPFFDFLCDNWDIAKDVARREFDVGDSMWRDIPDTGMV